MAKLSSEFLISASNLYLLTDYFQQGALKYENQAAVVI